MAPSPSLHYRMERKTFPRPLARATFVVSQSSRAVGHFWPPSRSPLADKLPTAGCLNCSSLARSFSTQKATDHLLTAELVWADTHFVFHRLHTESVKYLPSGRLASLTVTHKLITKLSQIPITKALVSYTLEKDFLQGKTRWVQPSELTDPLLQHHFLTPLLIVNLKSLTSPIRLCQNQATKHTPSLPKLSSPPHSAIPKKLSFNDTVHKYGGSLITPSQFTLHQSTAVALTAADVCGAFCNVALHKATQLMSLGNRLKNHAGIPSLDPSECPSNELFVIADAFASFGESNLPFVLAACFTLAADTFKSFAPSPLQASINPTIFKHACFILKVLAYIDDLPLVSSLLNILEHQQSLPSSPLLTLIKSQQNHNQSSLCASLSSQQYESFLKALSSAALSHQKALISATLTMLTICGFSLKSIDSSDPSLSILHSIHHSKHPLPQIKISKPKPPADSVFRENGGGAPTTHTSTSSSPTPFLTQMAKCMFNTGYLGEDKEGVKTQYLLFAKLKQYNFSGELHSFEQFEAFLSAHKNSVTRRLVVSILAQMYDPKLRHLAIPTVLAKLAMYNLYTQHPNSNHITVIGWEHEAPPTEIKYTLAAVRAFFLVCKTLISRSNIIYHSSALRFLILLSDASPQRSAQKAFLITGITVGGSYKSAAHPLNQQVLLNRPDSISMPALELFSLYKNVSKNLQLITWLSAQGLGVSPAHVIIATDSSSAALQLKSLCYSEFSLRVNFLCSKTASILVAHGLDPVSNIYHLDQSFKIPTALLPPTTQNPLTPPKITFNCDLLTKHPNSLSNSNILKWNNTLLNPGWLAWHPRDWGHLSRNVFIPKPVNKSYLESLNVNPAYIKTITARLESLRLQKLSHLSEKPPTPTPKHIILASTVNTAPSSLIAPLIANRQRILFYRGGVIPILAKVIFAFERLKFLSKLPPHIRSKLKTKRTKQYFTLKDSTHFSAWCGIPSCGDINPSICKNPTNNFGLHNPLPLPPSQALSQSLTSDSRPTTAAPAAS